MSRLEKENETMLGSKNCHHAFGVADGDTAIAMVTPTARSDPGGMSDQRKYRAVAFRLHANKYFTGIYTLIE